MDNVPETCGKRCCPEERTAGLIDRPFALVAIRILMEMVGLLSHSPYRADFWDTQEGAQERFSDAPRAEVAQRSAYISERLRTPQMDEAGSRKMGAIWSASLAELESVHSARSSQVKGGSMSERNFLNVSGTLPPDVSKTPERVQEFVRSLGGTFAVGPWEHYNVEDRDRLRLLGYVTVEIKLPVRDGLRTITGQSSVWAALQRHIYPLYSLQDEDRLRVGNDRAWIVGNGGGPPERACRDALLQAWAALVELARFQHAQDAISSILPVLENYQAHPEPLRKIADMLNG